MPLNQGIRNNFLPVNAANQAIQMLNGRLVGYPDNPEEYIVRGYNVNDVIYSIINLITDKVKVAPWAMYKIEDEGMYKELNVLKNKKSLTAKEYGRLLSLQDKAIKPVTDPGIGPLAKWVELLKYPNPEDTFQELVGNSTAYKLLTGNKYLKGTPLAGGANKGVPDSILLLPSQWVSIFATFAFPAEVTGYSIPVWGLNFRPDEVAHEKMFNPNWQINGDQLYGMSPLRAALLRLKKNNSLTAAEAATFQNEGIKGIVYMKNQVGQVDGDMVLPEVRKIKETLIGEWSGPQNRGRIGLSGYELGYIPVGMTGEEMEIIESSYLDLRYFCNIYGVPSQLLNDPLARTYNTQKEVEKQLTSRCAVPRLNEMKNTINRKGAQGWNIPKGYVADYDISCYPELQADVKETAEWTSKLIAVSPNEQRELCGLAALPEPEMSEPWVTSMGRQPLKDFQQSQVDQALIDEAALEDDPNNEDDPNSDNTGTTGN